MVAAGEASTGVALLEEDADWSLAGDWSEARRVEDGWRLGGQKLDVKHASSVDALLVITAAEDGLGAFLLDPAAVELTPEPAPIDPSSAPHRARLDGALAGAAEAVLGPEGTEVIHRALRLGAVASAAEGLGAASRALDLAIVYSHERVQFGRAIGEFQALQHLMAEAHVHRETAMATILYAAASLEEDTDEAAEAVAIAKTYASRGSRAALEAALQVLGGIAFTWEHDAHLLQRRVLDCERRYGDAIDHERTLRSILSRRGAKVPA